MNQFNRSIILCIAGMTLIGCVKKTDEEPTPAPTPDQPVSFDWKTTKQVPVNIQSDNGTATPVFIYDDNTLVAAGYTPFNENITVPVSATKLSVTTLPKDPTATKAYPGNWIWPSGQIVEVTLANGVTLTLPGLIDLHADIFVKWDGWKLSGYDWASFVDYWNAGATQNSSIILYTDKEPFIANDGSRDVAHSCLWSQCHHGEEIGGTSTINGTYLFEDLFPSMGDYDMNDMVVEESATKRVGTNNKIQSAELVYRINAVGSGVEIAMAVNLPNANASNIEKIEMFRVDATGTETPYVCANTSGLFQLQNGVELSGSNQAVVPLFDNIRTLLVQTSTGKFFNTVQGGGQGDPVVIKMNITFKSGSNISADGLTDLFIMPKTGEAVNSPEKWRGHEIHLADAKPTSKMDMTLFGTGNSADAKNPFYKTFRSNDGYVWAIYLPVVNFKQPLENLSENPNKIYDSYPGFKSWIQSGGSSDQDWYLHPDNTRVWNRK